MEAEQKTLNLLTREEAANIIGVNPRTLDTWRHNGHGPAYYTLGKRFLYTDTDVTTWIASRRKTPTPN